jgi:hypothetical protein
VIVTSAITLVAQFEPKDISLETGVIAADKLKASEVPFLRFRKQLSPPVPYGGSTLTLASLAFLPNDEHRLASAKERTVFVVQARYLAEFLKDFNVDLRWPSGQA